MTEQPSSLKWLRGIANAESDAHGELSVWRDTTIDPEVRAVLAARITVAGSTCTDKGP